MNPCPICETEVKHSGQDVDGRDTNFYDCPNCGKYLISFEEETSLGSLDEKARAVLSHGVWMHQREDEPFKVQRRHIEEAEKDSLPNRAEQLDHLLVFYAQELEERGCEILEDLGPHLHAKIGAVSSKDVLSVLRFGEREGLFEKHGAPGSYDANLTLRGWQRFRELQKGKTDSRMAFMAMPFGNPEVVSMVDGVFRPAVEETGFHLKRIDDEPPAGLIDNRLRVDIGLCRFLIADLTDGNNGVYWEAGFAEGRGKPVIFTCSKAYFEKNKSHFDTEHHQTVIWDPKDPDKAGEALKVTIRATLPDEAKMSDE